MPQPGRVVEIYSNNQAQKWCKWIEQIVTGGSVSVKVNDELGYFFQTKERFNTRRSPLTGVIQYNCRYAGSFD